MGVGRHRGGKDPTYLKREKAAQKEKRGSHRDGMRRLLLSILRRLLLLVLRDEGWNSFAYPSFGIGCFVGREKRTDVLSLPLDSLFDRKKNSKRNRDVRFQMHSLFSKTIRNGSMRSSWMHRTSVYLDHDGNDTRKDPFSFWRCDVPPQQQPNEFRHLSFAMGFWFWNVLGSNRFVGSWTYHRNQAERCIE